jgi:hypothetical protein
MVSAISFRASLSMSNPYRDWSTVIIANEFTGTDKRFRDALYSAPAAATLPVSQRPARSALVWPL